MKAKSVTISDRHVEVISAKAKKYGITFSDALRRMIDDYCEVEENDETGKNRKLEEKRS